MRKLIVLALAVGGIPLVVIKSSRSSAEGAATPLSQMVFTQRATDEFYGTKIAGSRCALAGDPWRNKS